MVRRTKVRTRQELLKEASARLETLSDEELMSLVDDSSEGGLTLADLIPLLAARGKHSILELKGLGKEYWRSIDVEEYIRQERDSWES
jgi:hypothetical protein